MIFTEIFILPVSQKLEWRVILLVDYSSPFSANSHAAQFFFL